MFDDVAPIRIVKVDAIEDGVHILQIYANTSCVDSIIYVEEGKNQFEHESVFDDQKKVVISGSSIGFIRDVENKPGIHQPNEPLVLSEEDFGKRHFDPNKGVEEYRQIVKEMTS